MDKTLSGRTLAELAAGLKTREFSSADIVRSALDAVENRDQEVKAFLGVTPENALREADAADARRARGEARSEWDGIPIGIKDNIAVRGVSARDSITALPQSLLPISMII